MKNYSKPLAFVRLIILVRFKAELFDVVIFQLRVILERDWFKRIYKNLSPCPVVRKERWNIFSCWKEASPPHPYIHEGDYYTLYILLGLQSSRGFNPPFLNKTFTKFVFLVVFVMNFIFTGCIHWVRMGMDFI